MAEGINCPWNRSNFALYFSSINIISKKSPRWYCISLVSLLKYRFFLGLYWEFSYPRRSSVLRRLSHHNSYCAKYVQATAPSILAHPATSQKKKSCINLAQMSQWSMIYPSHAISTLALGTKWICREFAMSHVLN